MTALIDQTQTEAVTRYAGEFCQQYVYAPDGEVYWLRGFALRDEQIHWELVPLTNQPAQTLSLTYEQMLYEFENLYAPVPADMLDVARLEARHPADEADTDPEPDAQRPVVQKKFDYRAEQQRQKTEEKQLRSSEPVQRALARIPRETNQHRTPGVTTNLDSRQAASVPLVQALPGYLSERESMAESLVQVEAVSQMLFDTMLMVKADYRTAKTGKVITGLAGRYVDTQLLKLRSMEYIERAEQRQIDQAQTKTQ